MTASDPARTDRISRRIATVRTVGRASDGRLEQRERHRRQPCQRAPAGAVPPGTEGLPSADSAKAALMPPCIRCASLDGFVELAQSLGLDPARQVARAGLDMADLAAPEKWIPAAAAAWLLEMSAEDSGCEDFSLRLSERRRLAMLGPLSVVLREEPDLRSALLLLIRYEYSYNEAISLQLAEANGLATIRVWLGFGEPAPTRQGLELAVASLLGVIRLLVRADWQAQAVCFSHSAPERLGTHRRLFGPADPVRPRVHRTRVPRRRTGRHQRAGGPAAAAVPPATVEGGAVAACPDRGRSGPGAGRDPASGGALLDAAGRPRPGPHAPHPASSPRGGRRELSRRS